MSETAHPLLPAATPLLRCGDDSIQVGGVDCAEGVLLAPAGGRLVSLLGSLDGRRSQRAVLADAARAGLSPTDVAAVLGALRATGLLVDVDAGDLLASDAGPAAAARTATELPSALARPGGAGWRARRAATVLVDGATRVGTPLAAILAASGVGRVGVRDRGLTAAGDAVVGGLTADDEGRPRSLAAADAIRRASPSTDLRPVPAAGAADVVVLARPWAASDPLVRDLHRSGVPHLVAAVRGETGIVGPLVVPGRTSCLRCADLHRRDADPRWPRLAAQLTGGEPPPSGATTTCLLTAATAALHVLAYLEGADAPVTLGATLELRPPDPVPRLRRWPVHPSCGCLTGPGAGRPEGPPRAPHGPDPGDARAAAPRRPEARARFGG